MPISSHPQGSAFAEEPGCDRAGEGRGRLQRRGARAEPDRNRGLRRLPPVAALLPLLLLAGPALAQRDLAEAERLRNEGVELFRAGRYGEAEDAYTAAIEAYGAVLGEESPDFLRHGVVLTRAVVWCAAQAGRFDRLAEKFETFYARVLLQGGNPDEERSVREALEWAMRDRAVNGTADEIDPIYHGYAGVLASALEEARAKGLRELTERIDADLGLARQARAEMLLVSGERDRGMEAFRGALAYWNERGDAEQAAWTAQNAFYEMTRSGRPEFADVLCVETLAALNERRFREVEIRLSVNVRNYLAALSGEGRHEVGSRFLEGVLVAASERGIFGQGMSEAYFRRCLDTFAREGRTEDVEAQNGTALAALGEETGSHHLRGLGAAAAAHAYAVQERRQEARGLFQTAAEAFRACGDVVREGESRLSLAEILSSLESHEDAAAQVVRTVEAFEGIGYGVGLTRARQVGLACAEAAGDEAAAAGYRDALRGLSAAEGLGGRSLGEMDPQEMVRRVRADAVPSDLLEITRVGDRLVFRNLIDRESSDLPIEWLLRHVNVSGVLLQVFGPEAQLLDILDDRGTPATEGETAMSAGDRVTHGGPQFTPFGQRWFVEEGSAIRVTSAVQLYRVGR